MAASPRALPVLPLMWAAGVVGARLLEARRRPVSYACQIGREGHAPPTAGPTGPACWVRYYDADAGMHIICACPCHTVGTLAPQLALEFV